MASVFVGAVIVRESLYAVVSGLFIAGKSLCTVLLGLYACYRCTLVLCSSALLLMWVVWVCELACVFCVLVRSVFAFNVWKYTIFVSVLPLTIDKFVFTLCLDTH